jgi:hypothetical protein
MVIELGIEVSEVDITSLSTAIDSRMRLASFEVGPSWARVVKVSVSTAVSVTASKGSVLFMSTMISMIRRRARRGRFRPFAG